MYYNASYRWKEQTAPSKAVPSKPAPPFTQTSGVHLVQMSEHDLAHTIRVGPNSTLKSPDRHELTRLSDTTNCPHLLSPPTTTYPSAAHHPYPTPNTTCTDSLHHLSSTTHHLTYRPRLFHLRSVAHTYLILIIYLYLYMYRKKSEPFKFLCDSTYRVCLREHRTLE